MKTGVSRFSVEYFWFHSVGKIRGYTFNVSEILGYRKLLWIIGIITIFRRKFLSDCTKIFHWWTIWCFRKTLFRKFSCKERGRASRFCQNFLFHRTETKTSVKEPFCFPESFWYRKKLWIRGGISRFSAEIYCLTVLKNFVRRTYCFSRKFLVSKSFVDEKEGGITRAFCRFFLTFSAKNFRSHRIPSMLQKIWGIESFFFVIAESRFSVENFLSDCTKKIHWITLWCFRKNHDFQSKFICFTVPKNFVRESYCFEKVSGFEKFLDENGGITFFRVKFLVTQCRNFSWASFNVWEKLGYRKTLFMIGVITIFLRKFFSDWTKLFHWRTLWCFRETLLSKVSMHRRGASRFCRFFFVSQDRNDNLCEGNLLFSEKFLVSKKIMDERGHITIFSRNFYISEFRKVS